MISIKNEREIGLMRQACKIAGLALAQAGKAVEPGITTRALDAIVRKTIESHGAAPSFLGYRGYPASANVSVNEEVIHGIPSSRRLKKGDIVSIDVGAFYNGFHGDTAATFPVGEVSEDAMRLIETAKRCFMNALEFMREGMHVSDISKAVERRAKSDGCDVVRQFTGHGIGRALHEDPEVPNFSADSRGARLMPGMTIAVEPMICARSGDVRILKDGWTVVTVDGGLSSHYEHTVLITKGEPVLLTLPE